MRRLTSASVASSGLEQCCGALLVLRTLPFMCFPSASPLLGCLGCFQIGVLFTGRKTKSTHFPRL